MNKTTIVFLTLVICVALGIYFVAQPTDANFSQYVGFDAWYRANPPSSELPIEDDRVVLRRYRPRLFVADRTEGPISFYDDYVASGQLWVPGEATPLNHVTREVLNAHKDNPRAVFEHVPGSQKSMPLAFARVDRGVLKSGDRNLNLAFLTYHFVFRSSGLPAGLTWWARALAGLIADPGDWHQLDHYTAVSLVIVEDGPTPKVPVAMTLQQHNYMRTYLLAEADGAAQAKLPADGRVRVDAAIGSNELYPHRNGRVTRRAASFMSLESARYLIFGERQGIFALAADDITFGRREVDYQVAFLPPTDAFYTFRGWLGARRWLPGRDGPPGADFNTLPRFKERVSQLVVSYWHEDDRFFADHVAGLFGERTAYLRTLARLQERFVRHLLCKDNDDQVTCQKKSQSAPAPEGHLLRH